METVLVVGLANRDSIAYAIADALADDYHVVGTYQGPKARKHLECIENRVDLLQMDVTRPEEVEDVMAYCFGLGGIDHLVHSIAYANQRALGGPVLNVLAEDFAQAMGISAYSLIQLAKEAHQLGVLKTVTAISYLGAERAVDGYGVMGVCKAALESAARYLAYELAPVARVNVLSPGPISTRAASGIPVFNAILDRAEQETPGDLATARDVAEYARFLISKGGRAITGQTLYVDGGYNIVG